MHDKTNDSETKKQVMDSLNTYFDLESIEELNNEIRDPHQGEEEEK